ncbi:MAG: hypothetical protein KGJ89_03635 [Patescibacteria group bacterium]|nr:hypothetical protein [Patescibacteria group bacterium]MDE2015217.1 hypothetical protein [Patescibacteria group bacterium]MDE2227023.1 hypothetical protein [Patescibacteria group bacterium]
MTQELAKQLKDAGFPQQKSGSGAYIPNLSELISACGKYFWNLRHTPDGKWLASAHFTAKDSKIPYYESVTYDEADAAVAELYLAMKLYERENNK